MRRAALLFGCPVAWLACAPVDVDQARVAFIRDTLTADNAVWMARDHALLEGKYAKMSADPFDFVRGTSALYYADLARPDPDRTPTAFLTVTEASGVLLAGDPHPENFSTMLPGSVAPDTDPGALGVEVDDLDGSGFGPYLLDVRRAALGLAVLADNLNGCESDCVAEAAGDLAGAYADEIASRSQGGSGRAACSEDDGRIVADLCAHAAQDGPASSVLEKYTTGTGATRRFRLDAAVDEAGKGVLALTADEDAQVDRLLADWDARPPDFRELDRARRYGSGVASFPAVRYVVLWDRGDASSEDDVLVNIREVVDPPNLSGRGAAVPVLFDSNAARIEEVAWLLWSRPDADPDMAGLADGPSTFKVSTWSGWFAGFDHADVAAGWTAGEYDGADLDGLAARIGRTLADAQARALTSSGAPALPAIAADIGGRRDAFVAELTADASADLGRSTADRALFIRALQVYGPALGADTPVDDVAR